MWCAGCAGSEDLWCACRTCCGDSQAVSVTPFPATLPAPSHAGSTVHSRGRGCTRTHTSGRVGTQEAHPPGVHPIEAGSFLVCHNELEGATGATGSPANLPAPPPDPTCQTTGHTKKAIQKNNKTKACTGKIETCTLFATWAGLENSKKMLWRKGWDGHGQGRAVD